MAQSLVEKYLAAFGSGAGGPDLDALRANLADDVRWHEAGSSEVLVGRDAVMERMGVVAGGGPDVTIKAALGDDDHVVIIGHADFGTLEYDFVEYYEVTDEKVTERWSFMDAVPAEVAEFFAG